MLLEKIDEIGEGVTDLKVGQRVLALTRFGGYAEYAITDQRGAVPVSDEMPAGVAVALATQYCTAYYCAHEMIKLYKGDKVLIHAAAGGVGVALVQLAKQKGCYVFGTASGSKMEFLKEIGVDYTIDYLTQDFSDIIKNQLGDKGLDVVFDSIGGKSVKKGYQLLGPGGRIICYGAASLASAKGNIFKMLRVVKGFGKYSPISLIGGSKAIIGVNMLRIADNKPDVYQTCLSDLVALWNKGVIKPVVGGEFNANEIAKAHEFLESRKSKGKIVVKW